jgi:hypothetical protein
MFDIILCVLATTKNNRLPVFSKIGYTGKNCKYKIVYLVDEEQRPDYLEYLEGDWHKSPGYPLSVRFCHYIQNTNDQAKWTMQVDDDSCTDLDKTLELLDYFYDHNDCMILTGSCNYFFNLPMYVDQSICRQNCSCNGLDPSLQKVLHKMNISHLGEDINCYNISPYVSNAWEHSIVSNAAINKLKNYNRLQEFIDNCLEFKPSFGDQVPYALCKIAKVPIANCYFLSPLPTIEEYSAVNKTGRFSHIHHVCEYWDAYNHLQKILNDNIAFENSQQVEDYLQNNISDSYWFFYCIQDEKIFSRCAIRFHQDFSISILDVEWNFNAIYNLCDKKWDLRNNDIIIKNSDNQELVFIKSKSNLYKCDSFILSRIHSTDILYLHHKKDAGILSRI